MSQTERTPGSSVFLHFQERVKRKEISYAEITQHFLKKSEADVTNSFLSLSKVEATKASAALDDKTNGSTSALTGMPLGIKDNIHIKGERSTCASKILENYVAPFDADVTARLRAEKSIFIGKLNMDEFAMGGSNENSAFGPVKNPVDPTRVPGGSSGGSAASVKAGLVLGSLGSDTGGSIRLPAAYCGVVGLKPTYGLVSRFGLVAFASSLDQIGPLAPTCEDTAILLSAIAGSNPSRALEHDSTLLAQKPQDYLKAMNDLTQSRGGKLAPLKIGLPREYFSAGLQPEVKASLDKVIKHFEGQGHTVKEVSLPHTRYCVAVYYIIAVSEASSNLSRFDGLRFGPRIPGATLNEMYCKTRSQFGGEVKRRIILGSFALSAGYYDAYYKKACRVRRLLQEDFTSAFKECDVLLGPVAPTTAFRIGEKSSDPLQMYLNDILTIPVNLAGLPAISVPCGKDTNSLPIGAQLIGPPLSEGKLLALGRTIEQNVHAEEVNYGI